MQAVNIYGTGENAVKFVLENRDLKISAFIEGKEKDKLSFMKAAFLQNVPVVQLEEAEKNLNEYYTVVASTENAYWQIKERLEKEYKLVEFENFEYFETFRKKVAIIYGNCHTMSIKTALQSSKRFSKIYGFYPLRPIQDIKALGGKGLDNVAYNECQLFIHQCIWEKNVYGIEYASSNILKKLRNNCLVIGIPNVYRMPKFLFPQIDFEAESIMWEGYNFFPFRDKYIDENYNVLSVNEIKEIMKDDSLLCSSDIRNEQEYFFEKVICREKEWDIKICDYLKDRLIDEQLFYDPNHPTNAVIKYIVNELLKKIGMEDEKVVVNNLAPMDTFEIPIYNTVKTALNLKYSKHYLRCYCGRKLNNLEMDLEEYIRQYIEWNFGKKRSE